MMGRDKRQTEAWPCLGALSPASADTVGNRKVQQGPEKRMNRGPRSTHKEL